VVSIIAHGTENGQSSWQSLREKEGRAKSINSRVTSKSLFSKLMRLGQTTEKEKRRKRELTQSCKKETSMQRKVVIPNKNIFKESNENKD
jgi:hypothetical protein